MIGYIHDSQYPTLKLTFINIGLLQNAKESSLSEIFIVNRNNHSFIGGRIEINVVASL